MDIHQSHLQEDGTTFPPVTRDAPSPPGVELPEALDLEIVAAETDDEHGESEVDPPD